MRVFYLLLFTATFAISLKSQNDFGLASNRSAFYITDTNCSDANPEDGIIWPCDFETISCDVLYDSSITGEPIVKSNQINQIKIDFKDVEVNSDASDCREILREWTVIDTRLYSQNSKRGIWTYVQKIKLMQSQPPVFVSDVNDQKFCIYEYDCRPGLIELKVDAIDDCTEKDELQYSYVIDLNNDGSMDFRGDSNDASDIFPYGKHKIKWFAQDGCGNISQCEYFFKVKDCKAPVSNCVNGLMVELSTDKGEITIKASDFNQGSFDNCMVEEFRIVSPSRGEGQSLPPTRDAASVTFDCSSVGVNSVDLWVKDADFNWSYCSTFVIIQNNEVDCEKFDEKEQRLMEQVSQFTEEVPIEIEKMYIPFEDIKQAENEFKIYPIQPNPFESETKISFRLEQKTKMNFTVQDLSGKVIKIIEKEFLGGYNEIVLRKEDFEEAGIYFFALKSKTHKATGKIVLIQR